MTHKPIYIKNLDLSFPHKVCFEGFSTQIDYGRHIGIIGRNGCGKSTLLKMLCENWDSALGSMVIPDDTIVGYVPQILETLTDGSGAERLNIALTHALRRNPNVLLLDEPTNHLDMHNRKGLLRLLKNFPGTLIIASHDKELLRDCVDTLWHIDHGRIHVFYGNYDDYISEITLKRASINGELDHLERRKKDMHSKLMREQQRAAKSRAKGEKLITQRKWPTVVSKSKVLRSVETSGRKKSSINKLKSDLHKAISDLRLPEVIHPKFTLDTAYNRDKVVLSVKDGCAGYAPNSWIIENINIHLYGSARLAIMGKNGSGKSTLVRAILCDRAVFREGEWFAPQRIDIGYLDQHYGNLDCEKSVLETITEVLPHAHHEELRRHLNDFLFRKEKEVHCIVSNLSGGEKARLSLAQVAAQNPKLLILDEVTNNLDLETKEHVKQTLQTYPGPLIIISHEDEFIKDIGVSDVLRLSD